MYLSLIHLISVFPVLTRIPSGITGCLIQVPEGVKISNPGRVAGGIKERNDMSVWPGRLMWFFSSLIGG